MYKKTTLHPDDQKSPTEESVKNQRRLSRVLMRLTLLVALVLGMSAGALQLVIDLRQEKEAVAHNVEQFLDSVVNSASTAVYNYYDDAAEQVAEGLFTQPAILSVVIEASDSDEPMVTRSRQVQRTLPNFGVLTKADEVTVNRLLREPVGLGNNDIIGSITVKVDRSVVPPAIVNRMLLYFILACVKNFLLGLLLVLFVFAALARHIVSLAEAVAAWQPGSGVIELPEPPRFLQQTELDILGLRIIDLAQHAEQTIDQLSIDRDEAKETGSKLANKSEALSRVVDERTLELRLANEKLTEMAEHDALTGLYNRGFFDRSMQGLFKEDRQQDNQISLMMIDVDFFKTYNDCYGHQAGDNCLISVAHRIAHVVAAENGLVARYGGEEFIVLFQNSDPEQGERVANGIVDYIAMARIPHIRAKDSDHVTVSIGVAHQKSSELETIEALYNMADEALYEAKRAGRNRVVVSTTELKHAIAKRRNEADELSAAIANSEFVPYYQPQYDGRTGTLIGVEALARWIHNDGSVLPPAAFLPLADELNIVHQIDRIILNKSVSQIEAWAQGGLIIPRLSVNASAKHLAETDFSDTFTAFRGVDDTKFSFELLETIFLDAADDAILRQIDQLGELGVDIEVDDFGTGRTSIVGLMKIKPARLKIARELVDPIVDDQAQRRVVQNIIDIGKNMEIAVLAEGVETKRHADLLIEIGCPFHQGFYYAKPMSADDLKGYIHNQNIAIAA